MRKIILIAAVAALALTLVGCGGEVDGLSDETYAEIWLNTYEDWDGETDAWDKALQEYGTNEEEYNEFTVDLLEADTARYDEVTGPINDDFEASMAYAGYTMTVGLGGLFEGLGEGLEEGLEGMGDLFGELETGINEGLEEASGAMGEAVDEAEGAMEEATEEASEETAQ